MVGRTERKCGSAPAVSPHVSRPHISRLHISAFPLSPESSVLSTSFHAILLLATIIILNPAISRAADLRIIKTAHYRIHTDLDDNLADDLSRRLDAMYDEYSRRLAEFAPAGDSTPLEAYVVQSKEKYLHIVGLQMAGTGGAFSAQRHLLAAFLDGQGRDALRRTLQHEAFHQFVFKAIGPNVPVWLNEGLAQVFEEAVWTGNSFELGQVPPRRLRHLKKEIQASSIIDFRSFLKMTPMQWAVGWSDPVEAGRQYNQAWAMAHFLVYATDDQGRFKYRARLLQMLQFLHDGYDGEAAFEDAFSSNIEGFQRRFMEYAAGLTPTPLAALIENQGVLADMEIQMRKSGHTFDTLTDLRSSCEGLGLHILYKQGNLQWESAADPAVYFRSPSGEAFGSDDLHFEISGDHVLPDLVCHSDGLSLRTRFDETSEGAIEHETIIESQR